MQEQCPAVGHLRFLRHVLTYGLICSVANFSCTVLLTSSILHFTDHGLTKRRRPPHTLPHLRRNVQPHTMPAQ